MRIFPTLADSIPRNIFTAVFFGLFAALGYSAISLNALMQAESAERGRLVALTKSFTAVFTEIRGQGSPVPATFRRAGIEHFSARTDLYGIPGTEAQVYVPGIPGDEIALIESDARIRAILVELAGEGDAAQAREEHRLENGRLIGRSIVPSIATQEVCVICHNDIFAEDRFEQGDVLGAFVVESDLTAPGRKIALFAIGAFGIAFAGGLLVAARERRRGMHVIAALRGRVQAERERRNAQKQIAFLASHDALTGLPNRAAFLDDARQRLAEDNAADLIVAMLDLDDFKVVNDTLGHAAGDALLKTIADRVQSAARAHGGVATRLGGDEFVLAFPAPANFDLDHFGAQLVPVLCDVVDMDKSVLRPGVSVGLARRSMTDGSLDELLQAADVALYAAKDAGKSQYRIFDAPLKATMGRRAGMARELPAAIASGAVYPALQPQIDLGTGRLVGFEALARWTWRGEAVPPTELVDVAEQNLLIRDLDLAILRQGARFIADLRRETGADLKLSSNISADNLRSMDILGDVRNILKDTGLDPQALTLEITESVFLADRRFSAAMFTEFHKLGVRLALDDFGTGFSALSYLTDFPFDTIKIDRSFLRNLDLGVDRLALTSNIVHLALNLGKTVVVEGLETDASAALMEGIGAQIGQGYVFSPPLPAEAAFRFAIENLGAPKQMPLRRIA